MSKRVRNMSEISDISSIIQESLLLTNVENGKKNNNKLQVIQKQLENMPSILNEDTLTKLKNGEYDISLKQYTGMNTYNTMMNALYGNNSANPFKNTLNNILGLEDDNLANAKAFIDKMIENGLSNSASIKLYYAIKSYSVLSSFNNYSFVKATV